MSTWESTTKPILVLTLSALVVSLLLALVNAVTAPVIENNQKAVTLAAYVQVLPTVSDATELEEITDYTTAGVTGAVKAPDGSIAVQAGESGFDGGVVTVIVGFDASGTVSGMSGQTLPPRLPASAARWARPTTWPSSPVWTAPPTSPLVWTLTA